MAIIPKIVSTSGPHLHTLFWVLTQHLDVFMAIYSDIYSGIYSDIYSGILSGIYSGIHFGILSGIYFDIFSDMGTAGPQPRAPDLIGQRPLRSGARSWRSGSSTDTRNPQLSPRRRKRRRRKREEGRMDGWMDGREEATPIKSRDPQEL